MKNEIEIYDAEEMYQMYHAGMSFKQIAEKTKRTISSVWYHVNDYQMKRAEQMWKAKNDIKDFKEMRLNKLFSLPDIQVGQVFVYGGEMFLTDEPHSKVEWSDIANKYVPNLISK